jgi:multicomponent Na+:H+ antiporter subunit E
MKTFLYNIVLALVWGAMLGDMSMGNLIVGFVLGYFALLMALKAVPDTVYFTRLPRVIGFACWFAWELTVCNLRVAREVLRPSPDLRPAFVAFPLTVNTDYEITILANLITLTPGTLSVDVSDDHKTLYVHALFVDNPEDVREDIGSRLERRLLEVLR